MSTMGAESDVLEAARTYASRGWPIFPVCPRGKRPIPPEGFYAATADERQLAQWWRETPQANIGFVPGRAGLLVFDWDSLDGKREAERLGLYSEPGPAVITARGEHLYFRHPGGWIGNRKLSDVLDVRADAGYVLLPPSIHASGRVYRWAGLGADWPNLPPKAWNRLQERKPQVPATEDAPPIHANTPRRRRYVEAAIEAECLALANAPEGTRNNLLNTAAFSLARFVETGEADAGRLVAAIEFAARHAGLDDEEITRTIQSAFKARGVAA